MDKDDPIAPKERRFLLIKTWTKILLVILIFLAPVVFTLGVFKPFVSEKTQNRYYKRYVLKPGFTEKDVRNVTVKMKRDGEFSFYFHLLPQTDVDRAASEVYRLLDKARSRGGEAAAIQEQQAYVEKLAYVFGAMNYPADFVKHPLRYPALCSMLWSFFYEEFKLDILGATFKSTYNLDFSFHWTKEARQAAGQCRKILSSLQPSQLEKISSSFVPVMESSGP